MTQFLLGIDAGNTLVKAVLFRTDGTEVASEHREGNSRHPEPGHVERDIGEMWACAADAIRGCLGKAGIDPADIAAIGCTGHGNGIYLFDGEDAPLLGIQSLDARAASLSARMLADGTGDALYPLALQKPWPAQTGTLLSWLSRNQPDLIARAAHVLFCKDVIVHFLTGRYTSDYSDASCGGILDVPARRYDEALLDALGLRECGAKLCPLAEPSDVVGRVSAQAARRTGLAEGTPVVAGLVDIIASAIGAGVARPGDASIVAGTWSINQVLTDSPLCDPSVFLSSTYRADRFMAVEASATSATNLEWFLKEFMADSLAAAGRSETLRLCSALAAEVTPALDLPLYLPYLYGSPESSAARASYFGIAGWHGRAHIIYAVMEGVAFGHRYHVEKLRAAGAAMSTAFLSGGAARSSTWPQIFADVLQIDVKTAASSESGALGAAMAAGIGVGIYDGFEDAASIAGIRADFRPDPGKAAILDERYGRFRELAKLALGKGAVQP
ncbi:FGGY-family carbohydrate kinase [Labrys monachus]|uniref:L-xylulokinase n=1 Tax=Labrys monachus TaxID=217067 RepID=A0ABU0FFF1_9HYPH|nr:FGGY-family carbohydrate kinase [Labrys monachus]MDQ0393337.1 L-xylulokinase [Labrys monachus]